MLPSENGDSENGDVIDHSDVHQMGLSETWVYHYRGIPPNGYFNGENDDCRWIW